MCYQHYRKIFCFCYTISTNSHHSDSGHWYPRHHLSRRVDIRGGRWGIGPEGGKAFSSHHIWMFIQSVRPHQVVGEVQMDVHTDMRNERPYVM